MNRKAIVFTLGCRLNSADSALLVSRLTEAGYEVSESAENVALIIVNSCTVTAESTGTATVTVTTADGGKTAQCTVTVYDANTMINLSFIAAVEKATDIGWDKNDDGTVSLTDANLEKIRAVTELNISDQKLTDLSGIEWFTGLTTLYCDNNQLTELDVSANTALTSLLCYSNQLTELDVKANTALMDLECYLNRLTTLDVSANTALKFLSCQSNQLTELDVSAITKLLELHCGNQTSDGTTPKSLDLFLTADQMTRWEMWKSNINNGNVNASVTQ